MGITLRCGVTRSDRRRGTDRRVVAAVAALALAVPLLVAAPAGADHEQPAARGIAEACPDGEVPATAFDDIAGNTHAAAIACIAWYEIAEGRTATTYDPAPAVRRDQMASFVARVLDTAGVDVPWDAPAAFADVPAGNVHHRAVNALAELEVVGGQPDGTYRPAEGVRRDQMASFLSRAAGHALGDALLDDHQWFADVGDDNTHFTTVNGLAEAGIVEGRDAEARTYAPAEAVRRDAMASFIARTVDLFVAEGVMSPPGDADALHEIWALDQGRDVNRINVYDQDLEPVTTIDFDGWDVTTPHMIDFDSQYRYAFVANTASGNVAVIRTADYEIVDVVETGAVAHMAAVTPDDSAIWVANIGAATFTEIVPDWDAETFEVGRELDVTEDPLWQEEFGNVGADDYDPTPVCHEYTADSSFAYLTLGPALGGLVVVDIEADEPEIVTAFSRDDVKANCGLALTHDGSKMYANWGDPGDPDGDDTETGEWYVFDTSDHTLIGEARETRGVDAHGVRITPDGSELWQVNRGTSNGIVVDTATDEIIDEIPDTGDTPDILDFSPDGTRAYISLRGPDPVSGAAHVATGTTPGFAVVDVESRELLEVVEPAAGTEDHENSDFHGLGVVPGS
jgi:DNA-binding beta-propeller fold protein YncE